MLTNVTRKMVRSIVMCFFLGGALITAGLWGVSYFQVGYVSPAGRLIMFPYRGYLLIVADWHDDSAGEIYRRSNVAFLRDRRLNRWVFYRGVPRIRLSRGAATPPNAGGTFWVQTQLPGFELYTPLFVPLILSLVYPAYSLLPNVRRNRRKKLGLCLNCGYNLHGLTEPRCPECGTPFEMSSKSEAVSSRTESSQQDATP